MQIKKFQMGGEAPVAAPEAAPSQAQDPVMEIASLMAQALQTGDCNIAMQACEAFLMLLQQASGSAQAPVGQTPEGQPVFKKGGKMVKRVKKNC